MVPLHLLLFNSTVYTLVSSLRRKHKHPFPRGPVAGCNTTDKPWSVNGYDRWCNCEEASSVHHVEVYSLHALMIFMTVCSSLYITCGVRVVYQIIPDLCGSPLSAYHACVPGSARLLHVRTSVMSRPLSYVSCLPWFKDDG